MTTKWHAIKTQPVLERSRGGTGLSVSGTAGNVLASDGTNWISTPLLGPDASSLTGIVAILHGGTGAASAAVARINLAVAASGANSDILSLSGLTTPLSTGQGGTGLSAPGASGNVLQSNGTIWTSATLSVSAGTLTGIVAVANGGTGSSTAGGALTNLGAAASGTNADIIELTSLSTPLTVVQGGTGASTATAARGNLGAAKSGSNSDITAITGLSTPLSAAQGGTGLSSPGTAGYVLTSTGTGWISAAPTGGGGGGGGATTFNGAVAVYTTTATLSAALPSTAILDMPGAPYNITLPNASTMIGQGYILKRTNTTGFIFGEHDITAGLTGTTFGSRGAFKADGTMFCAVNNATGKLYLISTSSFAVTASLTLDGTGLNTSQICINATTCYVPSGKADGKLYAVDISNPLSPFLISAYTNGGVNCAWASVKDDGLVVLLSGTSGLYRFFVTIPTFSTIDNSNPHGASTTTGPDYFVVKKTNPNVISYRHWAADAQFALGTLNIGSDAADIDFDPVNLRLWVVDINNDKLYTSLLDGTGGTFTVFANAGRLSVAKDGTYAYVSTDNSPSTIAKFNPTTYAFVSTIYTSPGGIRPLLAFSPDSAFFAAGCPAGDGTIEIFDVSNPVAAPIGLVTTASQKFDQGGTTYSIARPQDWVAIVATDFGAGVYGWEIVAKQDTIPITYGGTGATTAAGARANMGAAASGINADITALNILSTPITVLQGGTGSTTAAGARTNLGAAASGMNADITSLVGLTTPLPIVEGGTGATNFVTARNNLQAAQQGVNADITNLSALTTPITIAQGGTGTSNAPSARIALGAATAGANSDITSLTGLTTPLSAPQGGTGLASPGASGSVLTSTGSAWVSTPAPGVGGMIGFPWVWSPATTITASGFVYQVDTTGQVSPTITMPSAGSMSNTAVGFLNIGDVDFDLIPPGGEQFNDLGLTTRITVSPRDFVMLLARTGYGYDQLS